MKKLLLVFTFSFSLALSLKAQTYYPMLDSVNRWSYTYNVFALSPIHVLSITCGYPFDNHINNIMFANQDTLINSFEYKKLYADQYQFSNPCLFGFLREDTAARKVYFQDVDTNNEVLLYDFSMQIGDSINIIRDYQDSITYYRLDSINAITIKAGSRREFFLNCHSCSSNKTLIWTESVGDLENLVYPYSSNFITFGPMTQCQSFPHDRYEFIICFEHNQNVYFDSCAYQVALATCYNVIDSCDYFETCSGISEITYQSSSLSPNPFHTSAILSISDSRFTNGELRIYDVMGRVVQQQIINNQLTIINRDGLGDGLYFYQLTNSDGLMLAGKFVVE